MGADTVYKVASSVRFSSTWVGSSLQAKRFTLRSRCLVVVLRLHVSQKLSPRGVGASGARMRANSLTLRGLPMRPGPRNS